MLDTEAVNKLVAQQITTAVNAQVQAVMSSDAWLILLEDKILKYTQDRILAKFNNSSTMPELVEAVKTSVTALFADGHIPGIDQYVDNTVITQSITTAVDQTIQSALVNFSQDSAWLARVEHMINQTVTNRTLMMLGSVDVTSVIQEKVAEIFSQKLLNNFSSTGIDDRATDCKLTILDDTTVLENRLVSREVEVLGTTITNDLVVKGAINIDNRSWDTLAAAISKKTLADLNKEWQAQLVTEVKNSISHDGINFDNIMVGDDSLVRDGRLSSTITKTNIQQLGILDSLTVNGAVNVSDTLSVSNGRVGINTIAPESALSVWDEEVSVSINKYKKDQAYIGTTRKQTLGIGTNKDPHIQIDPDGLTTITKLRVGQHMISHSQQLPGWAGTRGDVVFNSNPQEDAAFAWMCTGNFNWMELKIK